MNNDLAACMRRHPAGKGRPMNNVIPLRQAAPITVGPPIGRRQTTETLLASRGEEGMTTKELEAVTGWHHGVASSALSTLHQKDKIARLAESRDACAVYVLPAYVSGRRLFPRRVHQGRLLDRMAESLRRDFKPCGHDPELPHDTCKRCEVRVLLGYYDKLRGSSN